MTTVTAEALYKAEHVTSLQGRKAAIFNPHGRPVGTLPVIYGFNNGSQENYLQEYLQAILIAEDGEVLGKHLCSGEVYMPADLGILEGTMPTRHERFRAKYPDGYRMEFVSSSECWANEGLNEARSHKAF